MAAPVARPHFLLFTESNSHDSTGKWRFIVQSLDSAEQVEVADEENDLCGDRLELLTVIRGLESLDQPSRVTLVTSSRFVKQGIDEGLSEWRDNEWTWERFGERVPVKHFDLWRRLDHALSIHQVQCRRWRLDTAHVSPGTRPVVQSAPERVEAASAEVRQSNPDTAEAAAQPLAAAVAMPAERLTSHRPSVWRKLSVRIERWAIEQARGLRLKASQMGTSFLPAPWLE